MYRWTPDVDDLEVIYTAGNQGFLLAQHEDNGILYNVDLRVEVNKETRTMVVLDMCVSTYINLIDELVFLDQIVYEGRRSLESALITAAMGLRVLAARL